MNIFKKLTLLLVTLAIFCNSIPVANAQEGHQTDQTQVFLPIVIGDQSENAEEHTEIDIQEVQSSSIIDNIVDRIPPEIKDIADTAKDITNIFSGITGVVNMGKALAEAFGILDSGPSLSEVFAVLSKKLDTIAAGLDWKITKHHIDQARAKATAAVGEVKHVISIGQPITPNTPATILSRQSVDEIASDVAFYRPVNENATDGLWKYSISDRPEPDGNGMVYDWRLGVPALMEVIALRLQVIVALDPNFMSNNRFDEDLRQYRTLLYKHYIMMEGGVKCGWQYSDFIDITIPLVGVIESAIPTSRRIACADIYTGTAAYGKVSISQPQADIDSMMVTLAWEVRRRMPLFGMRTMIDTLNLYAIGEADLTQAMQRIPVDAAQHLCLDVQWGNPAAGTPVWIWDCNGNDAQQWIYDRKNSIIRNPVYDKCLDVPWGNPAAGTPVWIWDCNGNDAQKWTYDPETRVLQNALGTVLDIQWNNLQAGTPVWAWPRNEISAQQWHADSPTNQITHRLYLPLVDR